MKQSNKDIAHKVIVEYQKAYYKEAYDLAVQATKETLLRAFRNRNDNRYAHNYTGNLINSIAGVVLVPPKIAKLAKLNERTPFLLRDVDIAIEDPFYKPMNKSKLATYTYTSSTPDYDYVATDEHPVTYKPELDLKTGAKGTVLATNWVNEVKLDSKSKVGDQEIYVQVHIGYTMEYAAFVEDAHHTLGAYKTNREAGRIFYHYIM